MRTILTLLIALLLSPAGFASPCGGEGCTCATQECCSPDRGCCDDPIDEDCGCRTSGCGECAACDRSDREDYTDTRSVSRPIGGSLLATAEPGTPRIGGRTTSVVSRLALPPPSLRIHVLNEVWRN